MMRLCAACLKSARSTRRSFPTSELLPPDVRNLGELHRAKLRDDRSIQVAAVHTLRFCGNIAGLDVGLIPEVRPALYGDAGIKPPLFELPKLLQLLLNGLLLGAAAYLS